MTTEERAAAWSTMTAAQRKAFIKSGQQLTTTSNERMVGKRADMKKASKS